jgi:hypothetical protein
MGLKTISRTKGAYLIIAIPEKRGLRNDKPSNFSQRLSFKLQSHVATIGGDFGSRFFINLLPSPSLELVVFLWWVFVSQSRLLRQFKANESSPFFISVVDKYLRVLAYV